MCEYCRYLSLSQKKSPNLIFAICCSILVKSGPSFTSQWEPGGTVQVWNRAPMSDRPTPNTGAAGHASFSASVFVGFKEFSYEMPLSRRPSCCNSSVHRETCIVMLFGFFFHSHYSTLEWLCLVLEVWLMEGGRASASSLQGMHNRKSTT